MEVKLILIVFILFMMSFLSYIGILMHKHDFSCFFRPQSIYKQIKEPGLYIRWGFKWKKIAEDTPQNCKKYSRLLGNFYISMAIVVGVIWILVILYEP